MERIDLDYWYTLGRALTTLEQTFGFVPCDLDTRGWTRINTALGWLKPIAESETSDDGEFRGLVLIPGTQRQAREIVDQLEALVQQGVNSPARNLRVDPRVQTQINFSLTAFHNILKSGAQDIYVFYIVPRGAYSVSALLEDASTHLSSLARTTIPEVELTDFNRAGACYATDLPTASGFHSMRAVEAEARRYHMLVTSAAKEVDWTLDTLINGNSGRSQYGLRDQWKKEGARSDSQLSLIISLLSSLTQIYRNPIMHPEMTLTLDQAKHVFDAAALAISAMVEDRVKRQKAASTP